MSGMDMTTRILKLYEALSRGKEIYKQPFCMEYEISERTFDRDIEKIRLFLSEDYSGREVRYNSETACYKIPDIEKYGNLSRLELLIIVKILKSEAGLEKREFEGLLKSLLSVAEHRKKQEITELFEVESSQYEERAGQKAFLKLFGDLEKCIEDRSVIRLNIGEKKIYFFPVALEYLTPEFYLLGYQPEEEETLQAYRLNDIESFQINMKKYGIKVTQRYSYQEGRSLLENITKKGDEEHETN